MIVFDLTCTHGHRFEGWFGSSDDFAKQQGKGLLLCPECGSAQVTKAPMAPAVPRKSNQQVERSSQALRAVEMDEPTQDLTSGELPPKVAKALEKLAEAQAEALKSSTWVGNRFAEESRAIHYGEKEATPIHGRASPDETRDLLEEGITVSPLLFPVVPPDEAN
ncbi:DUF1178 family protein [Altererythrobacter indicus]|uniref:DUF1178 family protein n=1 Tax=Altericroceibacterium indicum TaxID=374177 RepID=A0A845A7P2_9SPHN|nr:DUF1178 family protein [Altericroceibacterium indicum]MXP25273.1 DUF1178 family protein [Altericroceibacterium indicum]